MGLEGISKLGVRGNNPLSQRTIVDLLAVIILNSYYSIHVSKSLRARTSVLDLWLDMTKWTKVIVDADWVFLRNGLHLFVVCCDSCSFTRVTY